LWARQQEITRQRQQANEEDDDEDDEGWGDEMEEVD